MQIKTITQNERDSLERLHYTAEAAKNITAQCVAMELDDDKLARYEERYSKALTAYEQGKHALEDRYHPIGTWNLDFRSCALTAEGFLDG